MGKQAKANAARYNGPALVCECGHPLSAHLDEKGDSTGYCKSCADPTVMVHLEGRAPHPAVYGCEKWRPVRGTVKAVKKLEKVSGRTDVPFHCPFAVLLK